MGLTVSDALWIMLTRTAREKALPFDPFKPLVPSASGGPTYTSRGSCGGRADRRPHKPSRRRKDGYGVLLARALRLSPSSTLSWTLRTVAPLGRSSRPSNLRSRENSSRD